MDARRPGPLMLRRPASALVHHGRALAATLASRVRRRPATSIASTSAPPGRGSSPRSSSAPGRPGRRASRKLAARLKAALPRGSYQLVPGGLRNVVGFVRGRDPTPVRRRRGPLRHEGHPRLRRRERRRRRHRRPRPARADAPAAHDRPFRGLPRARRRGGARRHPGREVPPVRAPRREGRGADLPEGEGDDPARLRREQGPGHSRARGSRTRRCGSGYAGRRPASASVPSSRTRRAARSRTTTTPSARKACPRST